MDTYITYKLQRTLGVYKFIIHPLFVDSHNGCESDTDGVGTGELQKSRLIGGHVPYGVDTGYKD